jgi:hypothetical protein
MKKWIRKMRQTWRWWAGRVSREFHPHRVAVMGCVFCGRGVVEGEPFCCPELEQFCREKMECLDGYDQMNR